MNEKTQEEKFIETAVALECNVSEKQFDEKLGRIARAKEARDEAPASNKQI